MIDLYKSLETLIKDYRQWRQLSQETLVNKRDTISPMQSALAGMSNKQENFGVAGEHSDKKETDCC